ncbi:MAG: alanine racemase [Proteobacteria bacterium]|nr:alanine racemase [Pseudomonadota bacterium]
MSTTLKDSPDITSLSGTPGQVNSSGSPDTIDRPTVATIDTSALKHNFEAIKAALAPETEIMAVVKADGYGHGALAVARLFGSLGATMFGVALPTEGAELRAGGITAPILLLGGLFPEQIESLFTHDLTPVVYDIETIERIDKRAKELGTIKPVHLKIDTGMARLGVQCEELTVHSEVTQLTEPTEHSKSAPEQSELEGLLQRLKEAKNVKLDGLLSHFAESDSENSAFSATQLARFSSAFETVRSFGFRPRYIHMANSAASVASKESHFNLVRPGIMLYGSYPAPHLKERVELRPALELTTRILQLKRVPAGTPISYGRTFVTTRESKIATLPIGYADGLPRALSSTYQLPHSLSHGGDVLVRGARAPIAGTICMDLTMCDVTDIPDVEVGDEVVIIGTRGTESISAEEIAAKTGTISYEVFCSISKRVPRVYI